MAPTNGSSRPADIPSIVDTFRSGECFTCRNGDPVRLDDPSLVYWVESGGVDVFLIRDDAQDAGVRSPLLTVLAGDLLFGFGRAGTWSAIAAGLADTRIRCLPIASLPLFTDAPPPPSWQSALERWFGGLGRALVVTSHHDTTALAIGAELAVKTPTRITTSEPLAWLIVSPGGAGTVANRVPFEADEAEIWIPVVRGLGVEVTSGSVRMVETSRVCGPAASTRWPSIQRRALRGAAFLAEEHEQAALTRSEARRRQDRTRLGRACDRLASLLGRVASAPISSAEDPVRHACEIAAAASGLHLSPNRSAVKDPRERAQRLAAASGIPCREVILRDAWWEDDHGPLVAFRGSKREPVALLPRAGHNELHACGSTQPETVTKDIADELEPRALSFYRALPAEPVSGGGLLRFGLVGARRDLGRVAGLGLLLGVTGFFAPWASGLLIDRIIPGADRLQLAHLAIGLIVAAVASAGFRIVQGRALLRVQSRSANDVQTAVWDRLFKLPVEFFSRYSAGDLTQRCLGVDQARQMLSTTVVSALTSAVFGFSSFALLWYYSGRLALIAALLLVVSLLFVALCGRAIVRWQRPLAETRGRLSGLLLQLFQGVAKLRVAGAESRAFAHWSEDFYRSSQDGYRSTVVRNRLEIFQGTFPILCTMALFAVVVRAKPEGLSIGDYVGFSAAFANLLGAVLAAGSLAVPLLVMVPLWDRLRPVLAEPVESDAGRRDPGELSGRLDVRRVSFRYSEEGPRILHDVSFEVKPGEFVALVGPSGSGKSTLFRLMLGFETPESGSVAYDEQDLGLLDLSEVRRQLGVVLQSGKLLPGDIFTNIVGTSATLTLDDAWEAARRAGFEDDVKSFPMGMQTVLTEGGGGLSGGQQQRLQIARALVHRPQILFFDEATSALDNRTQEIVTKSVAELKATRIVIAHRLSTIQDADRILCLHDGQLVESGTYEELMRAEGLFYRLAKRQLLEKEPALATAPGSVPQKDVRPPSGPQPS